MSNSSNGRGGNGAKSGGAPAPAATPAASTPTLPSDTPTLGTDLGDLNIPRGLSGAVTQEGEDEPGPLDARAQRAAPPLVGSQDVPTPTKALHTPVVRHLQHEREAEVNLDIMTMELPELEKLLETMERPDHQIESVGNLAKFDSWAEEMAFLEEPLIIQIHEDADPSAENPVMVYNNGRSCAIRRGVPQVIRRKFVEQLMRAKPETVRTKIDTRDQDKVKNLIVKQASLKYPFSILRDDSPRSRAWQKKILSER